MHLFNAKKFGRELPVIRLAIRIRTTRPHRRPPRRPRATTASPTAPPPGNASPPTPARCRDTTMPPWWHPIFHARRPKGVPPAPPVMPACPPVSAR
eukprot:4426879-Prymnesium_polylepis.2